MRCAPRCSLGGWLATLGPDRRPSAVRLCVGDRRSSSAASFLVPSILFAVAHGLERPVRRLLKVEDWLAITNLAAAVPRLSISVAALAVSLSMMVAVSRDDRQLPRDGDLLGRADAAGRPLRQPRRAPGRAAPSRPCPPDVSARSPAARMWPRSIDSAASKCPTVTPVCVSAAAISPSSSSTGRCCSRRQPTRARRCGARSARTRSSSPKASSSSSTSTSAARCGCPLPHGVVPFRVAAVYYDYSSDRGVLVMDRPTFVRHYGDRAASGLSVYLRPGTEHEAARAASC